MLQLLNGKFSGRVTAAAKGKCWDDLAGEVSAVSGIKRSAEDELTDEELMQAVTTTEGNMLPQLSCRDIDDYFNALESPSLIPDTDEDVLESYIEFSPPPPLHLSPTMQTGDDVIVISSGSSSTLNSDTMEEESSSDIQSIDSFSDVEPN